MAIPIRKHQRKKYILTFIAKPVHEWISNPDGIWLHEFLKGLPESQTAQLVPLCLLLPLLAEGMLKRVIFLNEIKIEGNI
ncbi:MAG: hypothetical protein Q9P14_04350 [candidate division KSB1 bacterium]|nr:hypothetical protein [candidate division KSB1 bacterium]